jgi:hypothetical protein
VAANHFRRKPLKINKTILPKPVPKNFRFWQRAKSFGSVPFLDLLSWFAAKTFSSEPRVLARVLARFRRLGGSLQHLPLVVKNAPKR